MNHVQQKGKECAVAALAMATGWDYETLRRTKAGTYWRSYHTERTLGGVPGNRDTSKDWNEALSELAARVGIDMSGLDLSGGPLSGPVDGRKLRGKRGVIYISWGGLSAHMVAFDGCTIYDSTSKPPEPLTLSEWRNQAGKVDSYQIFAYHHE